MFYILRRLIKIVALVGFLPALAISGFTGNPTAMVIYIICLLIAAKLISVQGDK